MDRRIILIIIGVVVIVAAGTAYFVWRSQQEEIKSYTINVEVPNDLEVEVFTQTDEHESDEPAAEEITSHTFTGSQQINLQEGSYIAAWQANDTHAAGQTSFIVNSDDTFQIDPDLSAKQLNSRLKEEQSTIKQVISSEVPETKEYYKVENGKLYKNGDWYAAKLTYTGNPNFFSHDPLRVVLHKEDNGSWRLVTNPPTLVVSIVTHTEIPRDIALDINER